MNKRIKYTDIFGIKRTIELRDEDFEGGHWHIDEEPFVVYDYEIKRGKFSNKNHDKAVKAMSGFFGTFRKIGRYIAWVGFWRRFGFYKDSIFLLKEKKDANKIEEKQND